MSAIVKFTLTEKKDGSITVRSVVFQKKKSREGEIKVAEGISKIIYDTIAILKDEAKKAGIT